MYVCQGLRRRQFDEKDEIPVNVFYSSCTARARAWAFISIIISSGGIQLERLIHLGALCPTFLFLLAAKAVITLKFSRFQLKNTSARALVRA